MSACSTPSSSRKYVHQSAAESPRARSATSTQPEIERNADRTRTDDDDRLAERDDDHETMPLAEVLRGDDEALGAREPGREPDQ